MLRSHMKQMLRALNYSAARCALSNNRQPLSATQSKRASVRMRQALVIYSFLRSHVLQVRASASRFIVSCAALAYAVIPLEPNAARLELLASPQQYLISSLGNNHQRLSATNSKRASVRLRLALVACFSMHTHVLHVRRAS